MMVNGLPSKEIAMIKKTFKVPDMSCTNCAMKLEALEDTLDGVKEINASYHRLQMTVEYDETRLTDEQIIAAVKKKGYQAILA
jgi:copper chaperone CopZ